MPDQIVSVIQLDTGVDTDWVVLLTIPLGDSDSITTLVSKHESRIVSHKNARKLFSALTGHNRTRPTFFATVDDTERAAFSPIDRIAKVPSGAFNFVNLVFGSQVAR